MLNVECSQRSQRGVALIITLILLAVVTIMAISFLAVARRERNAVSTVTDTAGARYAADAALAQAEAQVIANVLSTTNPYNFGLLVSTNYINPFGFQPGVSSYTNVNYDYRFDNAPLALIDRLQNLTNLYYSPRPPVFIPTNATGGNDFRFYLDLNRNGRFDTNGPQPVFSWDPANPYFDTNGNTMVNIVPGNTSSNFMVGDPEWIGILERPDAPYGPNNKFIARYAFIAVPVGNTLDLNAIHNQALTKSVANINNDGYFRNQGVGSWELNLAAFLTDLNTNQWDSSKGGFYQYLQVNPIPFPNAGAAFNDAFSLLSYRYANNYFSLLPASSVFMSSGRLRFNYVDDYSDGRLQTTLAGIDETIAANQDDPSLRWAGADNTNHFFTHQELFDPAKTDINVTPPGFTERLQQAGTNVSTYDRYTFYRLLSQLGTDTAPESDKMNINYDNLYKYLNSVLNTNGFASATNLKDWQTPTVFFTNAADRLLRAYTAKWRADNPTNFARTFYTITDFTSITNADHWTNYPAFGLTNIPVLVSNQFVYSPAVNRLLQLAANIYDATIDNTFAQGRNYPSVFRPTFWVTNQDGYLSVYINGYEYIGSVPGGAGDPKLAPPIDVTSLIDGPSVQKYPNGVNVYGVPWIIGAKRNATNGFPAFNKFSMQNVVAITRKLQIKRNKIPIKSVTDFDYTNQLYVFSVSNSIGIDCWNSYSNSYPNPVQIVVNDYLTMTLTNDWSGAPAWNPPTYWITTNLPLGGGWLGTAPWTGGKPNPTSFQIPINTTIQFLTNSAFYFGVSGNSGFFPVAMNPGWETNKHDFTFPHFGLLTTNRLQLFMLDSYNGFYRVIDYLQFAGPDSSLDLNAEIQTNVSGAGYANMWSTNLNKDGIPWGILSQIEVSQGLHGQNPNYWSDVGSLYDNETLGFNAFMTPNGATWYANPTANFYASNYIVQVPYTPTITTYEYTSWQANDPLVHYMTSDLNFYGTEAGGGGPTTGTNVITSPKTKLPRPSFNTLNERYQPWGIANEMVEHQSLADTNPSSLAFKDPLVRGSDSWDFPTNKFPTVGWLGRVHRGTPWQSVYLKATNILKWVNNAPPHQNGINTWEYWTGNMNSRTAPWTAPLQDRLLFDVFTTALNDNASRGTLSINQTNLAAWSALFSGVVTVSNNAADNSPIRFSSNPQNQNPPPIYVATNIIQPAGLFNQTLPLAQQPVLVQIVQSINHTRATFTNTDGLVGAFEHLGDILAVPRLSEQSPFLHWNSAVQQQNGISDEMYEWLPQQVMSLLRCPGSPRYVIYCYGQALKPAPDGIYNGKAPYFGMVTNYQVVSEIATRAVVQFGSLRTNVITYTNDVVAGITNWYWFNQPAVTNNHAVIEQFNILPPD